MTGLVLKVLLIGAPNVGKTSLLRRFITGQFHKEYRSTVGVDVTSVIVPLPEGSVQLAVFDVGGQSGFDELRLHYYRNAHYVIFVFDAADPSTLSVVTKWYEPLIDHVFSPQNLFVRGMLVANKIDLLEEYDVVLARGKRMASLLSLDFIETSAKTGQNVAEMFIRAANEARLLLASGGRASSLS